MPITEHEQELISKAIAHDVGEEISKKIDAERSFLFRVFGLAISVVSVAIGVAGFIGFQSLKDVEDAATNRAEEAITAFVEDSAPSIQAAMVHKLYLQSLAAWELVAARLETNQRPAGGLTRQQAEDLVRGGAFLEDDRLFNNVLSILPSYVNEDWWNQVTRELLPLFTEKTQRTDAPSQAASVIEMFDKAHSNMPFDDILAVALNERGGGNDVLREAAFQFLLNSTRAVPQQQVEQLLGDDWRRSREVLLLVKSYPHDVRVATYLSELRKDNSGAAAELLAAGLRADDVEDPIARTIVSRLLDLDYFISMLIDNHESPNVMVGLAYSSSALGGLARSHFEQAIEYVLEDALQAGSLDRVGNIFAHIRPQLDGQADSWHKYIALESAEICGFLVKGPFEDDLPDERCVSLRASIRVDANRSRLVLEASTLEGGGWSDVTVVSLRSRNGETMVKANFAERTEAELRTRAENRR